MIPKISFTSATASAQLASVFYLILFNFKGIKCQTSMEYIKQVLENNQVIPDVLDKAPQHDLKIIYGDQAINFGNFLLPTFVHTPPTDIAWPTENKAFYTLIMTDPDAPSRSNPKNREWQHWVVGNIPEFRVKLGEVLTEYIGAIHPKGNGLHRYVFVVYKQPEKLSFGELVLDNRPSDVMRANFSTVEFAKKYKLGDPHAANFFVVDWGK